MAGDEVFVKEIKALHEILNDGNIEEVRKMRQTKVFSSLLSKYGPELIAKISLFLNDKRLYKCPNIVDCYEEILRLIVDEIDPQEMFVTLLEQIDEEQCCLEKFIMLLAPMKFTLQKLGATRGYWLEWTLSTFKCYLESLPSPEDHRVEFDEKKMLIKDQFVDDILHLTRSLVEFYEAFIGNVLTEQEGEALIVFGFHLLTEPAVYIYLEKFDELQELYDRIVKCIHTLFRDAHYFLAQLDEVFMQDLEKAEKSTSMEKEDLDISIKVPMWEKILNLPLAVYYSHIINDEAFTNVFPLVYSPLYLFHKLFYLGIILLRHSHNAVIRKGLLLCERLLTAIEDGSIPYYYLDCKIHKEFVKLASNLSVHSYIFENRKTAVDCLQKFIRKFDTKGTYLLFLNITQKTRNEDVDGEIITIFRRNMHRNFVNNKLEWYQKGKLLIDLLKVFAQLSEGSDTNLMKFKNKIISFLYLFALILRRDSANETKIHDYFGYFDVTYFSVVKEAVKKSRENYKRDANSFINDERSYEDNVSIVVEGQVLPKMLKEDKINATKNALTALSMIEHAMELVYEYANRNSQLL